MSLLKRIEGAALASGAGAVSLGETRRTQRVPPVLPVPPATPAIPSSTSGLTHAIAQAAGTGTIARSGGTGVLLPLGGSRPLAAIMARDSQGALRGPAVVVDPSIELRSRIQQELLAGKGFEVDFSRVGEMRQRIQVLFNAAMEVDGAQLTRGDRARLFEQIAADILGYGPLQPLLEDETISEIMVNGPKQIYIERGGKLVKSEVTFQNDGQVMRIIDRIIAPLGRRCDESTPFVDARLPDGSRVNIIIPPLSLVGPTITIRKFSRSPLTTDDLIKFGTLNHEMVTLLRAAVEARLNIVVAGGTGSGKTTLLNVLSSFIPDDERVLTIEDSAELQLRQEHVVTLETRPANIEGKGAVTIRDLVKNSLRMRPDRIIVGECRSGEALDMLQAMNTGHDGSMTTIHSNTPRDTLSRIETMCLMAGMDLPLRAVREQLSKAIEVIVQQARMRDGSRKVTYISEVLGMEGDVIIMQDIFVYEQSGIDGQGRLMGRLRPTGIRPKFMDKLEASGIYLPGSVFNLRSAA